MPSQSAFCRYFVKHACVSKLPNNPYQHHICPNRTLDSTSVLETPPGLAPRPKRDIEMPDTIYYMVRLHGDRSDHPRPENIENVQDELRGIFEKSGITPMPIACKHTWRADQWEQDEAMRFDETMPSGHGQEARLEQQKYERTSGDVVLAYPFPADRIGDVCKAMEAVQAYRNEHCLGMRMP